MCISVEVIKYLADSQTPNKPAVIIIQWFLMQDLVMAVFLRKVNVEREGAI